MAGITKAQFIREYSKKMMEGNAALFIGAGFSQPAGYVNWKELMRDIAEDLGLDIDKEYDLIALAQYHNNQRRSRTHLNEKLIEEFTKDARPTVNHPLLAQLPVHTVWTTNYDTLLEDAFKRQHRRVDVKITTENIAQTRPGVDVTIFKMHGDVAQADKAVLTKDDYESYSLQRELFTIRLKGDLVSLTFLFLGFSFTDPNIDYIMGRIKNLLGQNIPHHYCIMRRPQSPSPSTPEAKAEYEYECRKLDLRIGDLQRFGIQTVLIDHYNEITDILQELNKRAFLNNVFVSGSADAGSSEFDYTRLLGFARKLGKLIIDKGYNLVSGFGVGIGSEVIVGAVEGASGTLSNMHDRLILRPFPQTVEDSRQAQVFREWRAALISFAGFSIFLAGNKLDDNHNPILADGVREEFDIGITAPLHSYPIPIGATGHVAQQIWRDVSQEPQRFYGSIDVARELEILGEPTRTDEELLQAIFDIIRKVHRNRAT